MTKRIDAWAMFRISSNEEGGEYKDYVYNLMRRFFSQIDPCLNDVRLELLSVNNYLWNKEGNISYFYIQSRLIKNCKLYYFNEESLVGRSILFMDHYSDDAQKKVFLIASVFETFLICEEI